MENVPNMVVMQNGHFRAKILNAFRAAGYARTAILLLWPQILAFRSTGAGCFVFGLVMGSRSKGISPTRRRN